MVEAGAKTDGERVRFDPELVTELISSVPSEFMMHARSGARLRDRWRKCAPTAVASAPNYTDRQEVGAPATVRTIGRR